MKAPKKVTDLKNAMTDEDKESDAHARQAQDGSLGIRIEEADAIVARHNQRPGVVALLSRTQWIKEWGI